MTARRLVIALVAAFALIALAVFTEVVLPRMQAERENAERLMLPPGGKLDALTVTARGAVMELRQGADGGWKLTSGALKDATADARAVEMIVQALRGTRVTAVIGKAEGENLASFGLAPPRAELAWTTPEGVAWKLALGAPVIGGQVNALKDGRIVLVPERVLVAADNGLDHFRAKRLLTLDPDAVARLDLVRRQDQIPASATQRLVLERVVTGDGKEDPVVEWRMTEPLGVPANPVRVASLLSRLASLEALGFTAEAPQPEDLTRTGLAEPAATLLIVMPDGTHHSLVIGDPSPAKHAWARLDDGPVVEIREDVVRDALLADDFWRDNRVVKLPRWRVVNLRVKKGLAGELDLEVAREPGQPWRVVRPTDAPVSGTEGEVFLEQVLDIQCGRFEDKLAQDPSRLDARWDFAAPGSLQIEALALLPDGTPRRANCELTPFSRDRTPYFAVRTIDEMGRVEACVTPVKTVDEMVETARKLVREASPAAASAPATP